MLRKDGKELPNQQAAVSAESLTPKAAFPSTLCARAEHEWGQTGHTTARALHSTGIASTHRRWDRDRFSSHSSSSPEDSSAGFSTSWLSSLLNTTALIPGLPLEHCMWLRCWPVRSSSWKEWLLSSC